MSMAVAGGPSVRMQVQDQPNHFQQQLQRGPASQNKQPSSTIQAAYRDHPVAQN